MLHIISFIVIYSFLGFILLKTTRLEIYRLVASSRALTFNFRKESLISTFRFVQLFVKYYSIQLFASSFQQKLNFAIHTKLCRTSIFSRVVVTESNCKQGFGQVNSKSPPYVELHSLAMWRGTKTLGYSSFNFLQFTSLVNQSLSYYAPIVD